MVAEGRDVETRRGEALHHLLALDDAGRDSKGRYFNMLSRFLESTRVPMEETPVLERSDSAES